MTLIGKKQTSSFNNDATLYVPLLPSMPCLD